MPTLPQQHIDAMASAGLLVDSVLGSAGYATFADVLRVASAQAQRVPQRGDFATWTMQAKQVLPSLREEVADWAARLVNHVGVLYELAVAAEAEVAATTPTRLHHEYLRAFIGYLTPREGVGSRPKGDVISPSDPLETLAAQALGIRDAVAVERGEVDCIECGEQMPRDIVSMMIALGYSPEDDGDEKGDGEKPSTVN